MPAGLALSRYVTFKLDGIEWALAYELKTPPAAPTTWSLKPPPTSGRSVLTDAGATTAIPINVAITGNAGVTGLRLVLDPVEQQTKRSLAKGGWKLCKTTTPTCNDEPISLPTAGVHKLWAVPTTVGELELGKYEGMLTVASSDKSSGESVSFSVNVSSRRVQLWGLIVILAGTVLATYVTVFVRLKAARNDMLEAAVPLREVHDNIKAALDRAGGVEHAKRTAAALNDVNKQLSDAALESKGLPTRIPSPWPARLNDAARLELFKRHVETQAVRLAALDVLVNAGIVALAAARQSYGTTLTQAQLEAFTAALQHIDAFASKEPFPPLATLTPMVDAAVEKFRAILAHDDSQIASSTAFATAAAFAADEPRTLQVLRLRMARTSLAVWVLVLLVTVLTGAYSLILTNPGFGTELDLLTCFFWGLGLPTGAALASATTSTVSTAFNVTRPQ